MKPASLDHLVITVEDLDASIQFYTRVLGMELVRFGEGRVALHFGEQKINLHRSGMEFEPKALRPVPGSADLCFVVEMTPEEIAAQLRANGIEPLLGPVAKVGARGPITSIYLRDPDGNLIELASYGR